MERRGVIFIMLSITCRHFSEVLVVHICYGATRILIIVLRRFGEKIRKKKKRDEDAKESKREKKWRRTSDIKWKNTVTVVELIVICVLHSVGIFQIVIGVGYCGPDVYRI